MKWSVLAAILLAGCTSQSETIYLGRGNDHVTCGPFSAFGGSAFDANELRVRNCVEDYQKAGYKREPKP